MSEQAEGRSSAPGGQTLEAPAAQTLEVQSGVQAVARLERAICGDALCRDPGSAEGMALAGARAASLSQLRISPDAAEVVLADASCVHHAVQPAGQIRRGAFELVPTSAQQAVDLCLAAHLLSRRLARAGLCSMSPELADGLELLRLPGPELLARLLDGATRTPVPLDRALVLELAEQAMRELSAATGRDASLVEYAGDADPTVALVACGTDALAAREVADSLSSAGVPAATLSLILTRPFPRDSVREALQAARLVFVVESADEASSLQARVRAALAGKAEVRPLSAGPAEGMLHALAQQLPPTASDPPLLSAGGSASPSRRLAVVPAGPWAEQLSFRVLEALGRLGRMRLAPRRRQHLGASILGWEIADAPGQVSDLLIAHPFALPRLHESLALVRPRSTLLIAGMPGSEPDPAELLGPEATRSLREREVRAHWIEPPGADGRDSSGHGEREAAFYVAGAGLAALFGGAEAADRAAAGLEAEGRAEQARWLREGARRLKPIDPVALDESRAAREVDFRPARELPLMPDSPGERGDAARWSERIHRFHRTGAGDLGYAPPVALRPAALSSLAAELRDSPQHPFVLIPGEAHEDGVASAQPLRALLADRAARLVPGNALADRLERLGDTAARLLPDGGPVTTIRDLLTQAGARLTDDLRLQGEERQACAQALEQLRDMLPERGVVMDLRVESVVPLYLALQDSLYAPLHRESVERISGLCERLRDLLELDRLASAQGRAPERVAAELGSGAGERVDPDALARIVGSSSPSHPLDEPRRARVQAALETLERYLAAPAQTRQPTFLCPPGLDLGVPRHCRLAHPDPMAAAIGYFDGRARDLARVLCAVRVAGLEAEARYRPGLHDAALADLSWESFTPEELALLPPVVVVTTGASLRQGGQSSLSELLRSSRPVHVLVLDEVAAPDEAEDLSAFHIDLGQLVIAHREAFALGSTLARPERLVEGLAQMLRAPRPGVALVRTPPAGPAALRALLAEAALWGRVCPDFRYDPDAGESWADRFDLEGNPQLERGWPLQALRHLHGDAETSLELAFTFADAVALEPVYLRHLWVVPPEAWDDAEQIPLADYLDGFQPRDGSARIPYLWVLDESERLQRAVLTRELALASRDRLRAWRVLQELAGYENAFVERAVVQARRQSQSETDARLAALEEEHRAALEQAQSTGAREAMERLAAVLTSPDGLPASPLGVTAPAPAPSAPAAQAPALAEPEASVEPEPEEEEGLSFDEPYIDGPLCTTCNECTNLNSQLFKYNADKQAYIADASAGSFAELVKAAELCPARCIHPGKPRADDASATPELVERAAGFA